MLRLSLWLRGEPPGKGREGPEQPEGTAEEGPKGAVVGCPSEGDSGN